MMNFQTSARVCAALALFAAIPLDALSAEVGRYEKFELTLAVPGTYSNPYDPDVVDVQADFTSPAGKALRVPGFFYQGYTREGSRSAEKLAPVGEPSWKIRFAPSELGTYRYKVILKDGSGVRTLSTGSFQCVPSSSHGFVRAKGRSFVFDDGAFYFPIGVNVPWFQYRADLKTQPGTGQWGASTYGADYMFEQYKQAGANWAHFWICSSNSDVAGAWAHPSIGCSAETVSLADSWAFDYIVDRAQERSVYFLPILKFKNQRAAKPDRADFLLFRYVVARWGYSTSIFGWEFCKEGGIDVPLVEALATYMKSVDPYDHLRTTSTWNRKIVPAMFASPLLDVAQLHDYPMDCGRDAGPGAPPYDARVEDLGLYRVDQKINGPTFSVPGPFPDYGKPFFMGETGLLECKIEKTKGEKATHLYDVDTQGLIFHGDVWGMVMSSSGAISPWYFRWDATGRWSNLDELRGVAGYVAVLTAMLKGSPIPDSAEPFTNYRDSTKAKATDARLSVTGRKNPTFAMLRIQNMTASWAAVLRDKKEVVPLSGTVTLTDMNPGAYDVRWVDTRSGRTLKSEQLRSSDGSLPLTIANLSGDIAAVLRRQ